MNRVNGRFLKQFSDLSSFPMPRLEQLAANLSVRSLKKNEIVFDQDEEAKLVYILLSGVVRLSYFNSHDGQTVVSLLPAGEFLGLDSLTPKTRQPFRCEAYENCSVGALNPKTFIEILLGVSYDSFLQWYNVAMHPGRKMYIHCIKGVGLDLRRRLALELLNLADRFGKSDARGVVIDLSISHEVLAGIVGASRQQVTEYLNEFDREKIISREGRRIIIKTEELRTVLEIKP
ncbi:MAG: Crp/Fnr family transcriptional regulator [Candidatus Binatia bacterium]